MKSTYFKVWKYEICISQVHYVRTCLLRVRKGQLTVSSSSHRATQQLFCHQKFFFNLHIFDVITWHPCIATAARWCESEPEINSRPVSGPYEYLSLTGELELSSKTLKLRCFVQRVLWSIPPIYCTATAGPWENSNQCLFQRAATLLPATPRSRKSTQITPLKIRSNSECLLFWLIVF